MSTILDEIVEKRSKTIENEKVNISLEEIQQIVQKKIDLGYIPTPFLQNFNKNKPFLISEIKKGSPSKGIIRENFDVKEIAKSYEKSNYVKAVSILTEPDYFWGNYQNIEKAKFFLKKPILMKDFIFDEYQIYKGYLLGASAILLIGSILENDKILHLKEVADKLNMEVLFETHTEIEYKRAIDLNMKIIGINNRNLKNFDTNYMNSVSIIEKLGKPVDSIVISESGILNNEIVRKLNSSGVDGFLIGETFMREDDIISTIKGLIDG